MARRMRDIIPSRWVFLLVLAQGCDTTSTPRQAEVPQAAPAHASSATSPETLSTFPRPQLSAMEKKYIGAAGGFLKTLNEQDSRLAAVMAGATTGESTLDMIKSAIQRAQTVESAGFHGDYIPAKVPTDYQTIDRKIKKTYQLHEAAFKELLAYWQDSNTAHISSGNVALQRAVALANECIAELTQQMKLSESR